MRFAFVSDIHANQQAWEATVRDIDAVGVDEVICLGDIVGYGPAPVRVLESVYQKASHFVLGNHDAVVGGQLDPSCFSDEARFIIEWTSDNLNQFARDFFAEMPMMVQDDHFLCAHAEVAVPDRFDYIFEPHESVESFAACQKPLIFVGHTHCPCVMAKQGNFEPVYLPPEGFVMESDCRYLVNAGSVGDPRDGDTRASYVVLDLEKGSVEFRKVPFDIKGYRADLLKSNLPTKPVLFDIVDTKADPKSQTQKILGEFQPIAVNDLSPGASGQTGKWAGATQDLSRHIPSVKITSQTGKTLFGQPASPFEVSDYEKQQRRKRLLLFSSLLGLVVFVFGVMVLKHSFKKPAETVSGTGVEAPETASDEDGPVLESLSVLFEQAGLDAPPPPVKRYEAVWPSGLMLHFPFDEGMGGVAVDAAGTSSAGALKNIGWTQGVIGSALHFNQQDSLVGFPGRVVSFSADQPFSIACWLLAERQSGGVMLEKIDPELNGRGLRVALSEGRLDLRLINEWPDAAIHLMSAEPWPFPPSIPVVDLPDAQRAQPAFLDLEQARIQGWQHVALTYDGSATAAGFTVFVGGKPLALEMKQDTFSGSLESDAPLSLNSRSSRSPRFMGYLDELQVYSRNLSAEDVGVLARMTHLPSGASGAVPDWERLTGLEQNLQAAETLEQDAPLDGVGLIAHYEALRAKARGTRYEAIVEERLAALSETREKALPVLLRELKREAAFLGDKKKYEEAVAVLMEYSGPLAEATHVERVQLARPYQAKVQQQKTSQQAMQTEAFNELEEKVATHLIERQAQACLEELAAFKKAYPDAGERFTALSNQVEEVVSLPVRVMDSFRSQEGQRIRLGTVSGSGRVTIEAVREHELSVNADGKHIVIHYHDLSPQEKIRRSGIKDPKTVKLVQGLLVYDPRSREKSIPYFKQSETSLGLALSTEVEKQMAAALELWAEGLLTQFKKSLGLPPKQNNSKKISSILQAKRFDKMQVNRIKREWESLEKSFGAAKVFKKQEALKKAVQELRPYVSIKPLGGAAVVLSLEQDVIMEQEGGFFAKNAAPAGSDFRFVQRPETASSAYGPLIHFDGRASALQCREFKQLDAKDGFTITFLAERNDTFRENTRQYFLSLVDEEGRMLRIGSDKVYRMVYGPQKLWDSQTPVAYHTWQFHMLIYEDGNMSFYVNGKLVGEPFEAPLGVLKSLTLGASPIEGDPEKAGTRHYFFGFMKDLHVYPRVLKPVDIRNLNLMALPHLQTSAESN